MQSSTAKPSVAIIGAGLAGVTAACQLTKRTDVTLLEKSRGFGGRMATRRNDPWQFNHGAQFFTARSSEFKSTVSEFLGQGLISEWQPKIITLDLHGEPFKRDWFEPHYVAEPSMNSLVKYMAVEVDVRLQVEVADVSKSANRPTWLLTDKNSEPLGEFDWVISAVPAPQCLNIMPEEFSLQQQVESARLSPCFALMLGFDQALELHFEAAVVRNSPVAWIASASTKKNTLLVHSDNAWAEQNFEQPLECVQADLLSTLEELLRDKLPKPDHIDTHRWRYARAENPLDVGALVDTENRLAACGDWCLGNRVEDAFLSGLEVARQIGKLLA